MKDKIKKIYFIRVIYHKLHKTLYDFKYRERQISYGNLYEDKIFYICRRASHRVGLFSYVLVHLEHIYYAREKGYIPVIDMKNYANTYLENGEIGLINAWEYYFEQPVIINHQEDMLEEAYKSKTVILGSCNRGKGKRIDFTIDFLKDPELANWKKLYKKYVRLNSKTQEYIDKEYASIIQPNDRVLGVAIRGTDYTKLKPNGHPIQPEIEEVIQKTDDLLKEWNCNKIYLCTESESTLIAFERAFPKQIVTTHREFYGDTGKNYVTEISFQRKHDKYLSGLEYLASIYILARCDCLLASFASGVTATLLITDGFEKTYFWDLGVYGGKKF